MRGSRLWLSLLCSAGLLSVGCGPPPPDVADGGDGVERALQLSAVGNVALTAHANDIITLRTQLVQTNSIVNPDGSLSPRPVAQETVRFKFLETSGQGSAPRGLRPPVHIDVTFLPAPEEMNDGRSVEA